MPATTKTKKTPLQGRPKGNPPRKKIERTDATGVKRRAAAQRRKNGQHVAPKKERQKRESVQTNLEDGEKRIVERGNGTKVLYQKGFPQIYIDSRGKGHLTIGSSMVPLLAGEENPATWTDEELLRGAPMRIKRVPKIIPLQVFTELVERFQAQARYRFVAELQVAIEKHLEIINQIDPSDPTAVQWAAIRELYDRVLGKPEETVKIGLDMNNPFMKMVAQAIVGGDDQVKDAPSTIINVPALEDVFEDTG